MTSPRIAYLVSQYPAASHTFIRREVESLRAHGLPVETFSIRRPSHQETTSQEDRHAVEHTWYVLDGNHGALFAANLIEAVRHPLRYLATLRRALGHRAPGSRALLWSVFHFAESIALARELRRRGIQHLHNHFANAGATVGMLAAGYLDLPWSLTLHGISETDYPAGLTLAKKIAAAEFVACVSWFGRAQAMRISAPRDWPKFTIVRCGLELAGPHMAFEPSRPTRDIPLVVCVARLSAEKGLLGLFDALAALGREGRPFNLVLVGDGPERETMERRAAELDILDRLTFVGRLDERATLSEIAKADLLVLPSFMEGLPVVLMEAMALGTPVVASRVAGVPELIEDGVNGLLFRPADWTDLAAKIRQSFDDEDGRHRRIDAARNTVVAEFDVTHTVSKLLARYGLDQTMSTAEPPDIDDATNPPRLR